MEPLKLSPCTEDLKIWHGIFRTAVLSSLTFSFMRFFFLSLYFTLSVRKPKVVLHILLVVWSVLWKRILSKKNQEWGMGNLGISYRGHEKLQTWKILFFVALCVHVTCGAEAWVPSRGTTSFFVSRHCCRMAGRNASPWTHDSSQVCLSKSLLIQPAVWLVKAFLSLTNWSTILCVSCVSAKLSEKFTLMQTKYIRDPVWKQW